MTELDKAFIADYARRHGLVVLHLDRDFVLISTITDQPEERIAQLSSVPQTPPRPPRGTGIVQHVLASAGEAERTEPHVVWR